MISNNDGSFKQLFSTLKEIFVEIFKKDEENPLYKELGVKKGLWNSVKYIIFVFITFPLILFKEIINLDYRFYLFVEKITLSVLWLFGHDDVGTDILAKNYQRFIKAITDKTGEIILPDLSGVQSVVNFYRGYKLIAIIVFVAIYLTIAILGIEALSWVFGFVAGKISAIFVGGAFFGGNPLFSIGLSVALTIIFAILFALIFLVYFGYMLYIGLKLIILQVYSIMYIEKKDYVDFIVNAIDVEVLKATEIYGEDVAKKALEGLIENFVLKTYDNELINQDKLKYLKNELLEKIEKGDKK